MHCELNLSDFLTTTYPGESDVKPLGVPYTYTLGLCMVASNSRSDRMASPQGVSWTTSRKIQPGSRVSICVPSATRILYA